MTLVAPARERGLKFDQWEKKTQWLIGRSREGAWIEINSAVYSLLIAQRRSREGAWIEIWCHSEQLHQEGNVAPARERGLKCNVPWQLLRWSFVAPARERGLKYVKH